MPTTYKILNNFEIIGECQGLPDSDAQGEYILFPPEMYGIVQLGNILITLENKYLELYFEYPVVNNEQLVAFKMYYH